MKNINSYIVEKLRINDNTKLANETLAKIVNMCGILVGNNVEDYIKRHNDDTVVQAIYDWVKVENVKDFDAYAIHKYLKDVEDDDIVELFINDEDEVISRCADLIIVKNNLRADYHNRKIYTNNECLICHEWNAQNYDRVFVKK